MDMLTKFSGGETPKLNKLGGDEFKKTKEKAKASIRKLAFDLLKLYQERERKKRLRKYLEAYKKKLAQQKAAKKNLPKNEP